MFTQLRIFQLQKEHACSTLASFQTLKAKGPGFNNLTAGSAEPVLVGLETGLDLLL